MYSFYLGIDLHRTKTYAVLIDKTGEVIDERQILNDEAIQYLEEYVPKDTFAVLEATRNWPFMYDLLAKHVVRVELASPKELKAISAAAVKTDRIDANVLAQLARLNYLPTAYAAPKEIRDLRLYVRHREFLIRQRTQCKNRIHAVLVRYNLISPTADLFGVAGREWLTQLIDGGRLRPAAIRVIAEHLALIDKINEHIKAIEQSMELAPGQKAAVKLLTSIPGVGKTIATIIVAEIGGVERFHSPKALCNWAGLTPRVRNSGTVIRHGHISKEGSTFLRGAMTRAAMVASRSSKRWYLVHEDLLMRCGKKGAKVAVARRLLTVVYHMLTRNEPYQENYGQKQTDHRGA
ncbi:MAG: IS110 family transposase [Anaerolineales bacterium]|nr:MAG: IS110 family transposase [Anaerolineales bacterium]